MESKHQTSSIILQLMGLDKVPTRPSVRDEQKVLSENYLQKVASIGVRKKRSSPQHHSFGMNTDEKEVSEDISKVVKAIRREKHHNPSKGNKKEMQIFSGKEIKYGHGEAGLCETSGRSKFQLNPKDETFNSRVAVLKGNSENRDGLKRFSFSGSGENSHLADGLLKEVFYPKTVRVYPEMRDRKKISTYHKHFGENSKEDLFQKYWGLRKNACANLPIWKSKTQYIIHEESSEDLNLNPGVKKFPSYSSYFNSNQKEENCIGRKSEKKCYMTDLSHEKPMPLQMSSFRPPPALLGSQNLQETCLINDEVKDKKHEESNMSKQDLMSSESSIDCLVSDALTEVVVRLHDNPTQQHCKSTAFILSERDIDSLSHTSYDSKQQDTSDFQEDSIHSIFSEGDPDSLGSFEGAYEPSPISVLDPSFGEDIFFSSKCDDDSSEVDEEFGLNISSDEDCGNESECDFEEKRDMAELCRAEESRDFSYVVEVLTEAGISNRSLFTDFSTWHSAEYPISPSVFEILEKKFGEQQLWKRSERRLLFDRINIGLLEILQPNLYIPVWEKPVSRRLNAEPSQDMIEEEMWGLLVAQEKNASKESADTMVGGEVRWIELSENIEDIVREIVKLLIEELANEIVLESF